MSDVTQILSKIEAGDQQASEELLPLVYEELRRLAAVKMNAERKDHTLQATALVHEAYVRLVDAEAANKWDSRGHFFAAAAEAMRRILVEKARQKSRIKHGGELQRDHGPIDELPTSANAEQILIINDALEILEANNPQAAQIVKLRFFAGMTIPEAAEVIDVSPRTADGLWSYGRAWLLAQFQESQKF